jgi:hypothetical protein
MKLSEAKIEDLMREYRYLRAANFAEDILSDRIFPKEKEKLEVELLRRQLGIEPKADSSADVITAAVLRAKDGQIGDYNPYFSKKKKYVDPLLADALPYTNRATIQKSLLELAGEKIAGKKLPSGVFAKLLKLKT